MSVYDFIVSVPSSRSPNKRSYLASKFGHRTETRWGALSFRNSMDAHAAMDNVIETMLQTYGEGDEVLERMIQYKVETNGEGRYPRVICNDGFEMSVQAHRGAYCEPRISFAPLYSEVEVGYPSEEEELLMPYAEDSKNPTDTVYGYVPSRVIFKVIKKHGGLKMGRLPELS